MYFHEDDYCQIQLVPIENLVHLEKEISKIDGISNESFVGFGFNNIHVRTNGSLKLLDKQITVKELEEILNKSRLSRTDSVMTGYASHREERKNTGGYGNRYCAILYDFERDFVTNIWLLFSWGAELSHKLKLSETLNLIGKKYDLILVDWNQLTLADLRNKGAIDMYLKVSEVNE